VPRDDYAIVEPVFKSILAKVWASGDEDVEVLTNLSPVDRAIYATHILEGELDNGGWYQAFFNGTDRLIEPAIEGYELLGLPDYAAHLRTVRALGFHAGAEESLGNALDRAYFRLSGSDGARARLVASRNSD
jgi:hypothetical protein